MLDRLIMTRLMAALQNNHLQIYEKKENSQMNLL